MNQAAEFAPSSSLIQQDLQAKLDKQRQAHLANPYPTVQERIDRIERLIDMIKVHRREITQAVAQDFGRRSDLTTDLIDLVPLVLAANGTTKHLKKWMRTEKRKTNFNVEVIGAKASVEYLPLGVVGNISAWNVPIQLSLLPVIDIFAAGNRCMLKPSEITSATSDVMQALVAKTFDESELTVVTGEADVASAFSRLKFDHILFTGSTRVGKLVAKAAAENLVPTTLELGGKNPTIISESCNLEMTAEKLMWAKSVNGAQVCLCPDMVYVHESIFQEFVELCKVKMKKLHTDFESDPHFVHVSNHRHAGHLTSLLDDAREKGAEVIQFGAINGKSIPPSLVIGAPDDARIMNEEIFGGPASLMPYTDHREVGQKIMQGHKPLAVYYFGDNQEEKDYFKKCVLTGGITINDFFAHQQQDNLPFGGVGESGHGAYCGIDGFKNFSHKKAVYEQSPLDPLRIMRPPYTNLVYKFVDFILKKR